MQNKIRTSTQRLLSIVLLGLLLQSCQTTNSQGYSRSAAILGALSQTMDYSSRPLNIPAQPMRPVQQSNIFAPQQPIIIQTAPSY